MPSYLCGFLEQNDSKILIFSVFRQLLQTDRSTQPGRAYMLISQMRVISVEEEITNRHRQCRHRLDQFPALVAEGLMSLR